MYTYCILISSFLRKQSESPSFVILFVNTMFKKLVSKMIKISSIPNRPCPMFYRQVCIVFFVLHNWHLTSQHQWKMQAHLSITFTS